MYRVAYDNGRQTENYFFKKSENAFNKAKELLLELNIDIDQFLTMNTRRDLEEGFILLEEIKTID